jgi:hypothetical protein
LSLDPVIPSGLGSRMESFHNNTLFVRKILVGLRKIFPVRKILVCEKDISV